MRAGVAGSGVEGGRVVRAPKGAEVKIRRRGRGEVLGEVCKGRGRSWCQTSRRVGQGVGRGALCRVVGEWKGEGMRKRRVGRKVGAGEVLRWRSGGTNNARSSMSRSSSMRLWWPMPERLMRLRLKTRCSSQVCASAKNCAV
jgi:hypothetical protein